MRKHPHGVKRKLSIAALRAKPRHGPLRTGSPLESPEQTREAVARIHSHFLDIQKAIRLEKKKKKERKNPHAVALGRLGGLKSGKARRARSAATGRIHLSPGRKKK